MNPTECVRLVKFVAARCPAMRMQDDTPEAWYVDLVEFDLTDALEAARKVSLDQTFVGIGDLVRECRVIVRRRQGQQRRGELAAELEAENQGELHTRPVASLTAPVRMVPVDAAVRADRRQMLRKAAHARRAAVAEQNQAAAEHRSRVDAARVELHPEAHI